MSVIQIAFLMYSNLSFNKTKVKNYVKLFCCEWSSAYLHWDDRVDDMFYTQDI